MTRTLLILFLLILIAPAVLADVTRGNVISFGIVQPAPEPRAGEKFSLFLNVFATRGVARNVVFDWWLPQQVDWMDPRCMPAADSLWRCTLPDVRSDQAELLEAEIVAPVSPSSLQSRAQLVSSDPSEPSPLSYFVSVWPRSPGELVARIIPFDKVDAERRAELRVEVEALTPVSDAVEVKFLLDVSYRMRILETQLPAGWNCTLEFQSRLSCRIPAPPVGQKAVLVANVETLDFNSGAGGVLTWIDRGFGEEERRFGQTFLIYAREQVVTNTADSGPGSLRQALLDATSGLCQHFDLPCRITFALEPLPDGQWHTIRLRTPLPEIPFLIVNTLTIDGGTQTRVRDSNLLGPEIEIDGSLLTVGDGLVMGASRGIVSGLSMHSFPGSAVVLNGINARVEGNYLGLDPTGGVVRPNVNRGIVSLAGNNEIENNVLSGNNRSGFFALGGSGLLRNNRIGVAADGVTPLGNHASGIYLGPASNFFVVDNVIAHNAHAGIAIHRGTGRFNTNDAVVGRNRIFDNANGAIDQGLDGPASAPQFTPAPPVLISAEYDSASESTVIRGTIQRIEHHLYFYDVHLFATSQPHPSGYGEGETYLGVVPNASREFSFRFRGNLTGSFVSGFVIERFAEPEIPETITSEFGRAIEVK